MKFISSLALADLVEKLESVQDPSKRFAVKLELFSTKMVRADKKLYGSLSESPQICSSDNISAKTYSYLISCCNNVYRDYDFSSIRLTQFHKVNPSHLAIAEIQNFLTSNLGMETYNDLGYLLFSTLDDVIKPWEPETEVFMYVPEPSNGIQCDDSPLTGEGAVSFCNYFFYNKTFRKLLFVSLAAYPRFSSDSDSDMFDMDG
ncbi:hypothetical protein P9112_014622 [Eukaryota sp. TZLM1-RC]